MGFLRSTLLRPKRALNKLSSTWSCQDIEDKFKGCLVGALIGDCYGKPYKLSEDVSKIQLQKYFDKLDGPYFTAPFKPYSSNVALSNSLAQSLIQRNGWDATDVAKRFTKQYFDNPHRDFGENIPRILAKLRGSKFQNVYGPASETHLGMGSYGNAAAARVAPVVLFNLQNEQEMVKMAAQSARITNSHQLGRNGAILQSWAIKIALEMGPDLSASEYLQKLTEKVQDFEIDEEGLDLKNVHVYQKQLAIVESLLEQKNPTEDQVVDLLGHARVAVYSVPTSIYCFLRCRAEVVRIETDCRFRRTVQYAVALGGDTVSIASMAGAIAGACYGQGVIGESLQRHCEGHGEIIQLAIDLAHRHAT